MIDIIMATYNGEKFISTQLDSILEQNCKEWKLMIHDDGSTDSTVDIIMDYVRRYPDKIEFIDDGIKTGGAKYNFFHLLSMTESEYIMFADQDDYWEKDKVGNALAKIKHIEKKYGDIPLMLHGDLKVTDDKLNITSESLFVTQKLNKNKNKIEDILVQNNVTGCTVICNRKIINMCKVMPEEAIMHDWWLALIAASFGKIVYMGQAGILYRQHDNNTEGAINLKSIPFLIKRSLDGEKSRKSIINAYAQAEKFKEIFGDELSAEKREVLDAYLSMRTAGKLEKYRTMYKYGFMKSGLPRIIGYVLFI